MFVRVGYILLIMAACSLIMAACSSFIGVEVISESFNANDESAAGVIGSNIPWIDCPNGHPTIVKWQDSGEDYH